MSDPAAREETIFNVAHQLSDPQDRSAYLDDACRDNKALRERVERLLEAELHADEFLARDPLGLEKENTGNEADKSACSGPDLGTLSASMVSVAPAPGDVLEDYEIIERIGGNMGLVFKARHRLLDRIVALKLLPADAITDPARLARFRRELKIMGQLAHPNLVTAVDARIVDRWHMVVMEFIDGTDLERLVETQGALPIADACEAARQAALALQYAHEHGLIHRDIKPANLMLTHAGTIKVIDMGLAVIQEESAAQLTQTGLVMGTMRYCAPEQFRDASRVDIRADIYSLGCTLYHLLTGKPPYSQRTTLPEVIQAHLNEPFPRLAEGLPAAPAELDAILTRMAAKDPAARFATPGEVAEALAPFARGADLRKRLLPANSPRSPERATGGGHDKTPEASPRKPEKRVPPPVGVPPTIGGRPGLIAAVLAALLGFVARPKRIAFFIVVLLLVITGAVLVTKRLGSGDPVVVLVDSPVARAVYDTNNIGRGRSNADELYKVLKDDVPHRLWREAISSYNWDRDETVVAMQPRLVVIHRSSFFHPQAQEMNWEYPPFEGPDKEERMQRWRKYYDGADIRLINFLGRVATRVPDAQFVVYSRGTDERWLEDSYRENWVKDAERQCPDLKGRITTMIVPGEKKGTFRDKATAAKIRGLVLKLLDLPEKDDSTK